MGSTRLRQGPLNGISWRSTLLGLVLGVALLAAAPSGASAAYQAGLGIADGGKTLSYVAGGEANQVVISRVGDNFFVTDLAVSSFTDAGGCQIDPPASGSGATATCPAAGVTLIRINGGPGDDVLSVSSDIKTAALLFGGPGDDSLSGGGGNDTLNGGAGDDTLVGGAGIDMADYSGSPAKVTVDLGTTAQQNTGGAGKDSLRDIESLSGSSFGDSLTGGPGANTIQGVGGNDQIDVHDGAGGDTVRCGPGDDTVVADTGDVLIDCEHRKVDTGAPPRLEITDGPSGFVSDLTTAPPFKFDSKDPATLKCELSGSSNQVDDPCASPKSYPGLADGDYTFTVTATDDFNRTSTASRQFTLDTKPPTTTIDTGPADNETIGTTTATFTFSANEPVLVYECQVDGGDYVDCTPGTYTTAPLAPGGHTFAVRARDRAGNVDQIGAKRAFTVVLPAAQPPASGPQAGSSNVIFGSLVLISGRSVKLVKGRLVPVSLTCSGQRQCSGRVTVSTDKPVRTARAGKKPRRRVARLGSKKFSIEGNKRAKILIPLSKSKVKLLRRLRRVQVRATIREVDLHGNPRISTRAFMLRAR